MSSAIAYAQSGHLCLATLHGNNSYQALNRILSFYPAEVRPTMLGDLASSLKAIVSQRLVRTVEGARVPAVEVMLNTKLVADLVEKATFPASKTPWRNPWPKVRKPLKKTCAPDHGKEDRPQGRHGLCRFAHQPDVAPAKRLCPGRQCRESAKEARDTPTTSPRSPRSCWTSKAAEPVGPSALETCDCQ